MFHKVLCSAIAKDLFVKNALDVAKNSTIFILRLPASIIHEAFMKNFVQSTFCVKILNRLISRNILSGSKSYKGEDLCYHILANVPSNPNSAFFSKHRIDRKPIYPGMRHRKCNINFQVLWTHPPNFVLLWGANMVETVLYGNSSSIWRASIVELP